MPMSKLSALFLTTLLFACAQQETATVLPTNTPASAVPEKDVHHVDTLNIHDPAVLADPVSKRYYVYDSFHYGHPQENLTSPNGRAGVEVFWSDDLVHWQGPELAYDFEEDSWANTDHAPWAPEVAYYQGKYYLFTTFHNYDETIGEAKEGRPPLVRRASQILVSDSPRGPFKRFADEPQTPADEMALDGTLWIEDGQPWMIYCQEWIQTGDGLIKAIRLSDDLKESIGEPITLINAGDVEWTAKTSRHEGEEIRAVVTDGPWPYRSKTGELMLLWSSWNKDKTKSYTTSLAYSDNGKLTGNWTNREQPLISGDRGHGNIFRTFDGQLMLALHRYFNQPHTRLQIFELEDLGDDLEIGEQLYGHP